MCQIYPHPKSLNKNFKPFEEELKHLGFEDDIQDIAHCRLSCKLRSLNTTNRVSSSTSISKINIAN